MATEPLRDGVAGAFGPNAWLVEEMYEDYLADPMSVTESWREFFADYRSSSRTSTPPASAAGPLPRAEVSSNALAATAAQGSQASSGPREVATDTVRPEQAAQPLRGVAARIAQNMKESLGVPTATSVHPVPAKLLEVNRQVVNNHLARTTGGKVSFTHLIGWAVVRSLQAVPALNAAFVPDADGKGTPGVLRHPHVGLGIAVDVEK
ncbi:MAG: 2-oxo acid dehydrogenase subunit E2, partial [Acidimicrobiales bacterium]